MRAEHAAVALDSANAPYSSGGTDEGSQVASQSMLGDYIFGAPSEDAMAVMSRAHHAVRKKENKRRSLSFLTSFLFNSCEVHSCVLSRDLPRQTPDLYRTQNTSPRKIENNNERCCVCLVLPCLATLLYLGHAPACLRLPFRPPAWWPRRWKNGGRAWHRDRIRVWGHPGASNALFFSTFPMLVPSLSWQNDRFYI